MLPIDLSSDVEEDGVAQPVRHARFHLRFVEQSEDRFAESVLELELQLVKGLFIDNVLTGDT